MSSHDGTLSIGVTDNLTNEIEQNLHDLREYPTELENFTIFRVPAKIREKNKELYEPRMISIGPYYNGNDAFQAMEKHKWHYLRYYLSRIIGNSLKNCVDELRGLESRARRCYFDEVKLRSDQFVQMMLLDGCFIIVFLLKWDSETLDAVFDVGWILPIIRSDLLLLENQIPFFVIQKLFDLLKYPDPARLVKMLLVYFSNGKEERHPNPVRDEIKHILHLYHHCYVSPLRPNELSARTKSSNGRFPRTIPSVTELEEAGVIFKCNESKNIFDIKFQNGTLEIPFISIEETRRSHMLNLVSFEQCYRQHGRNLTSYANFMGCLFKTPRDVTLLQKKGIIDNLLPTNEELVTFFCWLTECSYLDHDAHYLKELFKDVNTYYSSNWHTLMATLKRNYFSNPWSIISFIAAFALLVLAFLQTLYTIFPYYHPRKN